MVQHNGAAARLAKKKIPPLGHHGQEQRGLEPTASSRLPQGRFGRMFRNLPAARFGDNELENEDNLHKLGLHMSALGDSGKDAPDDEESGIPALYTYFGQFIDHDITFDPTSSLQRQNDPNALVDYRTPAFDLDNLYGRGPNDQPYLYNALKPGKLAQKFLLGNEIRGGKAVAWDLPRNNADPARALIGDPRNDENAIVSQLQGLFLRFHNWMVETHEDDDFATIQQLVRFHYQYVLLNDFLPRIVRKDILDDLKTDGRYDAAKLKYFRWENYPFMPVEFSVAAYRLGHSMVRPGYRLNHEVRHPIFTHGSGKSLAGLRAMDPAWGIDWARFIDVETRKYRGSVTDNSRRLQFAYKIDTLLVYPLTDISKTVADLPFSLAERNLLRGWRLGLPSGQDVARAMGVEVLKDADIRVRKSLNNGSDEQKSIVDLDDVFKDNCPLWTYILAEAARNAESISIPVKEDISLSTPKLGPVGGRIVAEVFLGLMFGDGNSMLRRNPLWQPKDRPDYALKDLVEDALKFRPNP